MASVVQTLVECIKSNQTLPHSRKLDQAPKVVKNLQKVTKDGIAVGHSQGDAGVPLQDSVGGDTGV